MIELYSNGEVVPVKVSKFPAGELYVKVENIENVVFPHKRCSITFKFEGSDSMMELALLVNALREACSDVQITLYCAYFPAARQDRVVGAGEAFGLRVYADMIRSMGFKKIITNDLHSDVLLGMMPPGFIEDKKQHDLWYSEGFYGKFCIVAPDAGAAKKAQKLADKLGVECYVASKQRKADGNVEVVFTHDLSSYSDVYVVDDICDGGATFIALAEAISRNHSDGVAFRLHLRVTHGIFSNGKDELYRWYSTIKAVNNMEKQQ